MKSVVIKDKNQTLVPPENYELVGVAAQGAYLKLTYRLRSPGWWSYSVVYLNDMGREVIRTTNKVEDDVMPEPEPESEPEPVSVVKKSWIQIFWETVKGML